MHNSILKKGRLQKKKLLHSRFSQLTGGSSSRPLDQQFDQLGSEIFLLILGRIANCTKSSQLQIQPNPSTYSRNNVNEHVCSSEIKAKYKTKT